MAEQVVRGMMPPVLKAVVNIHESLETASEAIEKEAKEMEMKGFKRVYLEWIKWWIIIKNERRKRGLENSRCESRFS